MIAWSGDYFEGRREHDLAGLANFPHPRCRSNCRPGRAVPSLEQSLKMFYVNIHVESTMCVCSNVDIVATTKKRVLTPRFRDLGLSFAERLSHSNS